MWPQQTPGKRQLQSEGTLLARELGVERTAIQGGLPLRPLNLQLHWGDALLPGGAELWPLWFQSP